MWSEASEALDLFEAHARARRHVKRFDKVELCEGATCVLRIRRGL